MLNLEKIIEGNDVLAKEDIVEALEQEIEAIAPLLLGRLMHKRAKETVRLTRLAKRVKAKSGGA